MSGKNSMENKSIHGHSFGELLKNSRKHKRLTQRHLADKMGVHYNTIYRWEQGDFLPETRGMVLELANKLDLSEPETRRLLEDSLFSHSFHWSVPSARNPFFTGREEVLQHLSTVLTTRKN